LGKISKANWTCKVKNQKYFYRIGSPIRHVIEMKTSAPSRQRKSERSIPHKLGPEPLSLLAFWGLAVALTVSLFALYSPSLNFQFILDDLTFLNQPRVRSAGHIWEYFSNYVWSQFPGGPPSFYRPLWVLWLRINFVFNEMSSWGWHLFSIGKHLLAAASLGLLTWKLLRDRVAVLIASTLFAIHPLHTESVAWVTVPDALTATAVFGCLSFYLQYSPVFSAEQTSETRKIRKGKPFRIATPSVWWVITSSICCLAALLTKESAIILPFIIFALALQLFSGNEQDTKASDDRAPKLASQVIFGLRQSILFLFATALYFLLRLHAFHGHLGAFTVHLLPWKTVMLSLPRMIWFYVAALLWPFQSHAFGNSIPVEKFSVQDVLLPALAASCALAVLTASLFWADKKTRTDVPVQEARRIRCALLLGTLLLVFPILPALNLNALYPGDFMHGRYAYLSCAGLMLLLATGWYLARNIRILLLLLIGLLTVTLAVLTFSQETGWKDNLSVFASGNQIAPLNHHVAVNLTRARVELALPLLDEGRCSEAIPAFEEATKQFPDDWVGWAALGNCFDQLNDLPKAEEFLRRAAELAHQPRVTEEWQDVLMRMRQNSSRR
jgi:hypothetical protein